MPTITNSSRAPDAAVGPAARRLRSAALAAALGGALFSALAALYQLRAPGGAGGEDPGGTAQLVLLFLSPYAVLALLAVTLARRTASAAVVFGGSAATVLWGIYWHLDVLVLRPSVIAHVLSPVLITGNQWLFALATGALALGARLLGRRSSGSIRSR